MAKTSPFLFIFAGLPGTGKTTLAKALAEHLGAVYLQVGSIEQAIVHHPRLDFEDMGDAGYHISHAIAADNLQLGHLVIADQVNDIESVRRDWRNVAKRAKCEALEIEIICSDAVEHRARVEGRMADIAGQKLPTWQEVVDRDYQTYTQNHIVIDTAKNSVLECVEEIVEKFSEQ